MDNARATRRSTPRSRTQPTRRASSVSLPPACLAGREPTDRVHIAISYNNGFPRHHQVSVGFLIRFDAWITRHRSDVIWRLL